MPSNVSRYSAAGAWVGVADFDDITADIAAVTATANASAATLAGFSPAFVGPRSDQSTQARFGHTSAAGYNGFIAQSNGENFVIGPNAGAFTWYQRNAANTGYDWMADLKNQKFQIGDLALGVHPSIGVWTLWLASAAGGGDYMLARSGGNTYVNASTGTEVQARINNVPKLTVNVNSVHPQVRCYCIFNSAAHSWDNAHFIAQADVTGHQNGARVAVHQPGYYAWQLRASSWAGALEVTAADTGAYGPIVASNVSISSSINFKRDVRDARTIGLERERIVVRHDSRSDVVHDDLDIMALRPVAFRPKVPTMQSVENDDGTFRSEPWAEDTWPGLEGTRERLGLIAEEVQTVVPSAVSHGPAGNVVGIDYAQITVALLAHVQRLTEEVATLRYRVTELEGAQP